jgi:hypothetical protein
MVGPFEMEQQIADQVDEIGKILSTVSFLHARVDQKSMQQAIQGLCEELESFLREAIVYHKKPGIRKLFTSAFKTFDIRFGERVKAIRRYAQQLRDLRENINLGATLHTKDQMDQATRAFAMVVEQLQHSIGVLSDRTEESRLASMKQIALLARLHTQQLCEALVPEDYDVEAITQAIDTARQTLRPQEHWEVRGLDEPIASWVDEEQRPLFWISGPHRKNAVSWVSPLSVDLAAALSLETDFGVSLMLCDSGREDYPTPDFVLRYFTSQILWENPEAATEYMNILSLRKVKKIGQSYQSALELFQNALRCARGLSTWPSEGYFFIIDRVDLILDTDDCDVRTDLLPALQRLCIQIPDVNVIVTSEVPPENVDTLESEDYMLREVYSEPERAVLMRLRNGSH